MDEQEKNQVCMILNNLKQQLKNSCDNKLYQEWSQTNKKIKFTNWVIEKAKKDVNNIESINCVCGHSSNKHQNYHQHDSSKCNVKGCDCDLWRWNKNKMRN